VGDATPTELLERGCSGGYAPACHRLGVIALRGASRDPERALDRFERASQGSREFGCFEAGALQDAGEGAEKDLRRAFRLYAQACDGGDMRGCNAVGLHLMYGRGVPVDTAGAARYFERACAARVEEACANLRVARTHPQD
jgi:TPR repeat protein